MIHVKKATLLSTALVIIVSVSLIVSLFFKAPWLWMDEVLSYILISDSSIAHLNDAVVSGMDANPPLFANVYWFIGHTISLEPQFLRAVSIVIFAFAIALFYTYTTTLIGTPIKNFVLITAVVSLTYLNLTLSTQIRSYSLFLLIGSGFFIALHQLITSPDKPKLLVACSLLGVLLVLTHNFGLFYVAASGAFFAVLFGWSKQRQYVWVLGAHGLIAAVWLVSWYTNFVIQTDAGKPHSWIPLPTVLSFFYTVGELVPSISAKLERNQFFLFLPVLRFLLVVGVFIYIALSRLKNSFQANKDDKAFMLYLLSGWIYLATICIALVVSFTHTSVFISRYLWPSHLLVIYQLVYAWYFFQERYRINIVRPTLAYKLLPVYAMLLAGFLFYQNRKVAIFPGTVLSYLPQLNKQYPVFVEDAVYFLPIWFHDKTIKVRYLLDWETAATERNELGATVGYKILKSVHEKYHVADILTAQGFNKGTISHFYVIDEVCQYQFEHLIQSGRVHIVRQLPIGIKGHRILECTLQS